MLIKEKVKGKMGGREKNRAFVFGADLVVHEDNIELMQTNEKYLK